MADPGERQSAWAAAPEFVRLPRQEIHVWLAALDGDGAQGADMLDLPPCEIARAGTIRSPARRREFVRSRQILRRLLSRYLGVEASAIALRIDSHGKPALADCAGSALQFNVSHGAGHVMLAFSCATALGVDIERLDRVTHWQAIARNNFSVPEQLALSALPAAQQSAAFMRYWISKEAYTKARGSGFQYGFSRFSLAVTAQSCTLLDDELDAHAVADWSILPLALALPLAATLAFRGPASMAVHCWRYP